MNKWGVRLIGFLFLIEAIYYFLPLITKTWHPTGFWEIDLVYAIVFLYTGIQLLRFHPSGRNWALFILWLSTLLSGFFLVWISLSLTTTSIYFANPQWLNESSRPIFALLLFVGAVIIFLFVPIYFLMRKDVKQLFQNAAASTDNNPYPQPPLP